MLAPYVPARYIPPYLPKGPFNKPFNEPWVVASSISFGGRAPCVVHLTKSGLDRPHSVYLPLCFRYDSYPALSNAPETRLVTLIPRLSYTRPRVSPKYNPMWVEVSTCTGVVVVVVVVVVGVCVGGWVCGVTGLVCRRRLESRGRVGGLGACAVEARDRFGALRASGCEQPARSTTSFVRHCAVGGHPHGAAPRGRPGHVPRMARRRRAVHVASRPGASDVAEGRRERARGEGASAAKVGGTRAGRPAGGKQGRTAPPRVRRLLRTCISLRGRQAACHTCPASLSPSCRTGA